MVEIALIADTHMPRGSRRLPEACVERIRGADLLVHAGDFSTAAVYEELAALGPRTVAVHGNVDDAALRARLPERETLELEGVRIGIVHDAGPKRGRLARLRGWFPEADAVVFAHSHLPLHEREDGLCDLQPRQPDRAPPRPEPHDGHGGGEGRDGAVLARGALRVRAVAPRRLVSGDANRGLAVRGVGVGARYVTFVVLAARSVRTPSPNGTKCRYVRHFVTLAAGRLRASRPRTNLAPPASHPARNQPHGPGLPLTPSPTQPSHGRRPRTRRGVRTRHPLGTPSTHSPRPWRRSEP